jgi:hypothetical protein
MRMSEIYTRRAVLGCIHNGVFDVELTSCSSSPGCKEQHPMPTIYNITVCFVAPCLTLRKAASSILVLDQCPLKPVSINAFSSNNRSGLTNLLNSLTINPHSSRRLLPQPARLLPYKTLFKLPPVTALDIDCFPVHVRRALKPEDYVAYRFGGLAVQAFPHEFVGDADRHRCVRNARADAIDADAVALVDDLAHGAH